MVLQRTGPPPGHQALIDRFVAACLADSRVLAAFLSGSFARGAADAYSDLDLCVVTTDEAREGFLAEREEFVRLLGDPLFLEDFDLPNNIFFVLSDGTEGEIAVGSESRFGHIHIGPYKVLLDKRGILAGASFPGEMPTQDEQVETLRRLIYGFWHDLSHFITAMGRGHLWWAYGQLEQLRLLCVNLARLRHDFSSAAGGYEKVEQALPVDQLSHLIPTFCPLEQDAMRRAVRIIVQFYEDIAPPLALAHEIAYPETLARLMRDRLARLEATTGTSGQ